MTTASRSPPLRSVKPRPVPHGGARSRSSRSSCLSCFPSTEARQADERQTGPLAREDRFRAARPPETTRLHPRHQRPRNRDHLAPTGRRRRALLRVRPRGRVRRPSLDPLQRHSGHRGDLRLQEPVRTTATTRRAASSRREFFHPAGGRRQTGGTGQQEQELPLPEIRSPFSPAIAECQKGRTGRNDPGSAQAPGTSTTGSVLIPASLHQA